MTASQPTLQRARGRARVGFKRRDDQTVLADLHQSGCAKLRLPRRSKDAPGEAVIINTSGGLTDGDHFDVTAHWAEGARATVTTQAAERVYRSRGGDARIDNRLEVAANAAALWLPQETILFDGGRFQRTLKIDLADVSAHLLACESIVFGRGAMGETVHAGHVFDRWRVRVAGELVFADGFELSDDQDSLQLQLDRPAVAEGARAIATAIVIAPDADAAVAQLRDALSRCNIRAGVSNARGVIVVRALAREPSELREALQRLLDAIVSGWGETRPFAGFDRPRVFDC
ncbi:MAG: urease accessory protein UreD [Pseudomonadota bacterium]